MDQLSFDFILTQPKVLVTLMKYYGELSEWKLLLRSLCTKSQNFLTHNQDLLNEAALKIQKERIANLLLKHYSESYRLFSEFNELRLVYGDENPDPFEFIEKATGSQLSELKSLVIIFEKPIMTDKLQFLKEFFMCLQLKKLSYFEFGASKNVSLGKYMPFYSPILKSCTNCVHFENIELTDSKFLALLNNCQKVLYLKLTNCILHAFKENIKSCLKGKFNMRKFGLTNCHFPSLKKKAKNDGFGRFVFQLSTTPLKDSLKTLYSPGAESYVQSTFDKHGFNAVMVHED